MVAAVDAATGRVRVAFEDVDITSDWLTVCYPKSAADKVYWLPELGEQVRCLMDAHLEDGAVLGCVYSDVDAVPWTSAQKFGVQFKDGASVCYDRASGEMTVVAKGVLKATAATEAKITAPKVTVDGNLHVTGTLQVDGSVTAQADMQVNGAMTTKGDMTGAGISIAHHIHIDSKGGNTSDPMAG
jgi:phage baseplate assembly protein V